MDYGLRNMIDSDNPQPNTLETDKPDRDEELLALLRRVISRQPEVFGDDEKDEFVVALKRIKTQLGIEPGSSVIYPGSSTHAGVARVFGKEHVQHVDPDGAAMKVMEAEGYNVTVSTIEDYHPLEQADVMVALNSYGVVTPEILDRLIKKGGYIIANNHTYWAHEIVEMHTTELVGAVMPDYRMATASWMKGEQIPSDATDIVTQYYVLKDNGNVVRGTAESHTFEDESARYPDALFIFKLKSLE